MCVGRGWEVEGEANVIFFFFFFFCFCFFSFVFISARSAVIQSYRDG